MTPGTFVIVSRQRGLRLSTGWAPRNDRLTLSGNNIQVNELMLIIADVRKNPIDGAITRHPNAYPIIYVLTPKCTGWCVAGADVQPVDKTD